MNLPEYIRIIGEDVAAKEFSVSVWTIRAWRIQSMFPGASKAYVIVVFSDGAVDLEGFYNRVIDAKNKAA
jgi:hypothetical protein